MLSDAIDQDADSDWTIWIGRAALALLLALVVARATTPEMIRDTALPRPGQPVPPRAGGATTSLLFDLAFCAPALLLLIRRILAPRNVLRGTLSHALFGAFALWAVASVAWASDKFLAAIAAAHLIGAASIIWTTTQLIAGGSWRRLRLVAGVCFGVLLIFVAQGVIYRLVDFPDNVRYWNEHRLEAFADRGWEPDSFAARQFEKKLMSGEVVGFNTSANTFGAALVMLGVVAAGAAVQRIRDRDEFGWASAIIVALLVAVWVIYLTQSRTALATPVLAAAALAAAALFHPLITRRPRTVYFLALAGFFIGAAAVVGHGLYHGTLFHDSLTFRWRYWVGSWRVFVQHPLVGVGWSSFADHYLAVRLPIASEEIKDPHNLLVRAFVELGIVGGALLVSWLARAAWEMTVAAPARLFSPNAGEGASGLERTKESQSRLIAWAIGVVAVGGMVLNVLASIDFSSPTPDRGWFIVLELFKRALFLVLLALGIAIIALRSTRHPHADDRAAPWLLRAVIVACGAFFVHNLIDFSLFEPGPMALLAMLAGAGIGMRQLRSAGAEEDEPGRVVPSIVFAIGVVGWVAAGGCVAAIGSAESLAAKADDEVRAAAPAGANELLRKAFDASPLPNADYAYRAAMAAREAGASPSQVRALLDAAIAANPRDARNYRTRAEVELRQRDPDPARVIADFRHVTDLNPADVQARRDFAEALVRFGQRQRAIEQYRLALKFNDELDPNDPKRLSSDQASSIRGAIDSLENR